MKIKALTSFCGALSMGKGQEMECNDDVVLQDLLQAGYVEALESTPKGAKKNESKRNNNKRCGELPKD